MIPIILILIAGIMVAVATCLAISSFVLCIYWEIRMRVNELSEARYMPTARSTDRPPATEPPSPPASNSTRSGATGSHLDWDCYDIEAETEMISDRTTWIADEREDLSDPDTQISEENAPRRHMLQHAVSSRRASGYWR